ncbi:mannose-6-phosphate isomerase, class I [Aestuariimicrobium sp. T2.26MG-19.2B]|uniref:mannose-6-phosphate isomerase, class I n=1 Tax=Aestuariimicrobium sp. T2.26MG-19.2B TaxID=3040679 RepID=UPI0024779AB5|nr:mannose-6-phosphate isomerase, class I [Aestuariimicrobium sp. T2.26MG-19.2B]CAI9401084.1 Mannose-6-phosphate isomerase [Aestuariimicrobium sp. T2.26MG-19.2B]
MKLITGVVKDYAWGSTDSIPTLLHTEPTGEPQAEYWLGAHLAGPAVVEGDGTLDSWLADHPEALGASSREHFGDRLPYLLKILAADQPLSLQAHPSREQAEAGFAAENEAGIPLGSHQRTYADDWPKPEMIVALTEMEALCGFRDPRETADLFDRIGPIPGLEQVIGPLTQRSGDAGLAETFLDVLSLDDGRVHLVNEVVAAAVNHVGDEGEVGQFARTAVELDAFHPSSPGILAALLLNRVQLQPGEAIFLPAGNMHAYLRGTGVEIMANSDNVLRGGLTSKRIDVDALVQVVDFTAGPVEVLRAEPESDGLLRFRTPAPEFALWQLDTHADHSVMLPALDSARILLVVAGHAAVATVGETIELVQGKAVFVPAGEQVQVDGNCSAFLAAAGV